MVFSAKPWTMLKIVTAVVVSFMALTTTAQESNDRLSAYIKILTTYNDNVFLTGNEDNDVLYTVYTGFDASFGTSFIEIGIMGEVISHDYDEFDEQDDIGYDLNPRVIIGTGENLLTLGLYGEFQQEYKPVDQTVLEQVDINTNTIRSELTLRPSENFGLTLIAAMTDATYDNLDSLNYSRTTLGLKAFKDFTDKTTAGVKYTYSEMDYDEDVRYDGETHLATVYLDYILTGKTKLHLESGYQVHEYDLSNGVVLDTQDDSAEAWYVDASVAYSPTPKFDVEAGITRQIRQSAAITSNYHIETRPYLDIAFKATNKLTAGVRSYLSEVDENNTFDSTKTAIEAKLNYAITTWFELEAGHEYTTRDSESPTGDYHRNVTTAGFVLRY